METDFKVTKKEHNYKTNRYKYKHSSNIFSQSWSNN